MVPLILTTYQLRVDILKQSVDLAIRDLLEYEEDPLGLALYLWVVQKHNLSLIRSADLIHWGIRWVRKIFIENQIGLRRDDEIVSASLIAISLAEYPQLQRDKELINASPG